jgi:hypothetical protein
MQAEAQEGYGRQTTAPSFDRQTAQKHKTSPFQAFVKGAGQAPFQRGQWEIVVTEGLPIDFCLGQSLAGTFNLCQLLRWQTLNPLGLADNLGTMPSGGVIDFGRQFNHAQSTLPFPQNDILHRR